MNRLFVLLFCTILSYSNAAEAPDKDFKEEIGTAVSKMEGTVYKEFYESGKLKYGVPLKEGKRNGIQRGYYESGKLKYEVPFVNGKARGYLKTYYENGRVKMSALYIDNKKEGFWKGYEPNGEIQFIYKFRNDQPVAILEE